MSGEASREAAFTKAQRCPYCHESIAVDEDAWVACAQCLGRHHSACWDESGSCSACSHTVGSPNQQAIRAPLDLAPLTEEVSAPTVDLGPAEQASPADHRRATARLFEEDEERGRAWAAAPMTPLTLGFWPIAKAESALDEHKRANQKQLLAEPLPEDLPADLREQVDAALARAGATAGGLSWSLRRLVLPVLIALGWVGSIGCLATAGAYLGLEDSGWWAVMSRVFLAAGGGASLGMVVWLNTFREAVRSHERDQLFVRLIARAVPPAASKDLLERLAARWTGMRVGQTLVSLLVPGLLLTAFAAMNSHTNYIPMWPVALALGVASLLMPLVFLALRAHAAHEHEADEVLDLYGDDTKPKGGSA